MQVACTRIETLAVQNAAKVTRVAAHERRASKPPAMAGSPSDRDKTQRRRPTPEGRRFFLQHPQRNCAGRVLPQPTAWCWNSCRTQFAHLANAFHAFDFAAPQIGRPPRHARIVKTHLAISIFPAPAGSKNCCIAGRTVTVPETIAPSCMVQAYASLSGRCGFEPLYWHNVAGCSINVLRRSAPHGCSDLFGADATPVEPSSYLPINPGRRMQKRYSTAID